VDSSSIDQFNRRRNEERRQAEQQRLAARDAAFEAEVAQLRQFLASVSAPADMVEDKVKELQAKQAARAAAEDAPAEQARLEDIARRFGIRSVPSAGPTDVGYRRKLPES